MAKKSKKNKKTGFNYQSRSKQDYDKSASESSGQWDAYVKDGTPKFQPHDGSNRIRVLPPTFEDAADFALTLLVHYSIGANEQTYLCRKMLGDDEECAICDEETRLTKEGEAEDAASFKSKKRKAAWLIDRKADEADPIFWAMPFGTWKDVVLVCKDEDGEVIELDHPEDGHDILFNKEGAKLLTKYTGIRLGKQKPIVSEEDDMEKILSFIQENPLNEILVFYENEYLQAALEGQVASSDDDDEEDDDDDDDDEKKPRRKSSSKKSSRDEDEDDDEDDDEDEDEDEDGDDEEDDEADDDDNDEEDEDDDTDDDEDEDDDEEEEKKPRRKSSDKKKGSPASRLKSAADRAKKTSKSKKNKSKRRK